MPEIDRKVSIREFASHLQVSDTIVRKRIYDKDKNPDGKLVNCLGKNDNNGRPMIWMQKGLAEWITHYGLPKNKIDVEAKPSKAVPENNFTKLVSEAVNEHVYAAAGNDPTYITGTEAERRKKVAEAKMAELKYEEALGLLVEKSKVYKELFEYGQEAGGLLMQIIPRVAPELAHMTNVKDIINLLRSEFEAFRLLMSRGPQNSKYDDSNEGSEVGSDAGTAEAPAP